MSGGVVIRRADPRDPPGRGLLEASHAYLRSLYPPEDNFFLSVDELAAPHVTFLVASDGGGPLGCIALADMGGPGAPYGEVKSMWVDPGRRGSGAGAALLSALEAEARARGLAVLRLETGDTLDAAHRLYRRAGFRDRGPFGDYREGPHSVFMEKRLE